MDYMKDCGDYADAIALHDAVERFDTNAKEIENDNEWASILRHMLKGYICYTMDRDGHIVAEAWVDNIYGVMRFGEDTFTGHRTIPSMRERMMEISNKWGVLNGKNTPHYTSWALFLNRGQEFK